MLGAIATPATKATTAKAKGTSTNQCSRSGTIMRPVVMANCRSIGARRVRPPKIAPPVALPSEFTDRNRPPSAGAASAVANPG